MKEGAAMAATPLHILLAVGLVTGVTVAGVFAVTLSHPAPPLSGALAVWGALTPATVRAGEFHTLSVTVTNEGDGPIEVTGVEVRIAREGGERSGLRNLQPGWGFRPLTVGPGETQVVWEKSGSNCGSAGNYQGEAVVHTNAGAFRDSFTYVFTS